MNKEILDCEDLCPNYYSSWEEGTCMECCEIYNRGECPVIYVNDLEKQVADLEQKLALTEKALELACSRIKSIYCSDYCGRLCDDWAMSEEDIKNECKIYYKCWNKDCILEQAKEMMKSE